jgi:hypothetical protein
MEEIEREIDATRRQMSHTVDVLREKISPTRIRARAMDRFRPGGRNSLIDRASATVKRNPLLYSLLGSAVLWRMLVTNGSHASAPRRRDLERMRAQIANDAYWRGRADGRRESGMRSRLREALGRVRQGSRDTAHEIREGMEQAQGTLRDRTTELGNDWYDYYHPQRNGSWLMGLIGAIGGMAVQAGMSTRRRPPSARPMATRTRPPTLTDYTEGMAAAESSAMNERLAESQRAEPGAAASTGLEDPRGPADR